MKTENYNDSILVKNNSHVWFFHDRTLFKLIVQLKHCGVWSILGPF